MLTGTSGREYYPADLDGSFRTNSADLDDGSWVTDIVKFGSRTSYDSPRFTKDLNTGGNLQGVGHKVRSRVEEEDLASSELDHHYAQSSCSEDKDNPGTDLVEDGLKRSSIIGHPITFDSLALYADNLADVVVGVCGPSLAEDAAILEQTLSFLNRWYSSLHVAPRVAAGIYVSLDPSVDIGLACGSSEDNLSTNDTNDGCDICGLNVIEDNRGLELGGRNGTSVENGGVRHNRVDDGIPTSTLTAKIQLGSNEDIKSDLRVVDGDPLEIPSPIPGHFHTGDGAVDCDVSNSELLVSDV